MVRDDDIEVSRHVHVFPILLKIIIIISNLLIIKYSDSKQPHRAASSGGKYSKLGTESIKARLKVIVTP